MKKDDLFIDVWNYADKRYPWQLFVGGRGIGKTYSFTKGWIDRKDVFCGFMRRTLDELELIADNSESDANIFYELKKDYGEDYNYVFEKNTKKSWNIVRADPEEVRDENGGDDGKVVRGIALPLSVIAGMRGLSYSRVTDIALDEFITEPHVRKIKNEGRAIINAYETICRNRELFGQDPCRFWAFANAFDIYNPLFAELNIVDDCEKMITRRQHDKYYPDRGLAVHLLDATEAFKKKKRETQVMRLMKGTDYEKFALGNQFAFNDFSLIGYKNLKGMRPLVTLNGSTIFYNDNHFYYSYALNKTAPAYDTKLEHDKLAFNREYLSILENAYMDKRLTFESYALKIGLLDVIL